MSESLKEKIRPWISIQRPFNCFLITMCAIVGIMVDQGVKTFDHWPTLIMIFIGGWALSAAAMVFNDYFDIEVDKINEPDRPIPSGRITSKQALTFGIVLIVIGILAGLGLDLYEYFIGDGQIGVSIVTAVVCSIMAIAYTNYMKRYSLLGNLAVSIGVWLGFLYGDLLFDFIINPLPESMAAGAFFLNFGREVMKGITDIEGDRKNNVTTVATMVGENWTAIISAVFYFLAVVVIYLIPIFLANASLVFVIAISVSAIMATICIVWVIKDHKRESTKKIKTLVLVTMLISLVVFTLEAFVGPIVGPLF